MFKLTYTKEEVNDLIKNEIETVKNELSEYINTLQKKNELLEDTVKELKNNFSSYINNKIFIETIEQLKHDYDTNLQIKIKTLKHEINMKQIDINKTVDNKLICIINNIKKDMSEMICKNDNNVMNIHNEFKKIEQLKNVNDKKIQNKINNIQLDINNNLVLCKETTNNLEKKFDMKLDYYNEQILVGYYNEPHKPKLPIFVPKQLLELDVEAEIELERRQRKYPDNIIKAIITHTKIDHLNLYYFEFILDSLELFSGIEILDLCGCRLNIIDKKGNNLIRLKREPDALGGYNGGIITNPNNKLGLKKIKQYCEKAGIKIIGSEYQNGSTTRKLIDDWTD